MSKKMNFQLHVLNRKDEYMTLDFGKQILRGKTYNHKGIDLIGNPSTNSGYDWITAFAEGKVIGCKNNFSGQNTNTDITGCGNYVIIQHSNGFKTRYMHMTKGTVMVEVGDKVKKGQLLGYMGDTGNVTGRHLHFDISHNGVYVDPKPYLKAELTFNDRTFKVIYKSGMNVRSSPIDGKVVAELPKGAVFTIDKTDSTGKWGHISEGWICIKDSYCTELF